MMEEAWVPLAEIEMIFLRTTGSGEVSNPKFADQVNGNQRDIRNLRLAPVDFCEFAKDIVGLIQIKVAINVIYNSLGDYAIIRRYRVLRIKTVPLIAATTVTNRLQLPRLGQALAA